jgi:hypothetical protein
VLPISKKRLTKQERNSYSIPENSKAAQALIGHILGDGHLQRIKSNKKNVNNPNNTRFTFAQSLVHTDYFYFVYNIFLYYCSGPQMEYRGNSNLTGAYAVLKFNTMNLPCLNYYHDLFFKNGVKIIPENIENLLTPISLSTWIMDDGTFNKRDKILTLCTDSFTELEIELLLTTLRNKYNLKCRKERKRKSFRIVIIKSSMETVRDIVSIHFHPSMLYKIGLDPNQ